MQARSGPFCATHFLDLGFRGRLHDALLVWGEPGSGAALPQLPHREGCCTVSTGTGRLGSKDWGKRVASVPRRQLGREQDVRAPLPPPTLGQDVSLLSQAQGLGKSIC